MQHLHHCSESALARSSTNTLAKEALSTRSKAQTYKAARLCNPVVDHYVASPGNQLVKGEVSTVSLSDYDSDPDAYPSCGCTPFNGTEHIYLRLSKVML